MPLGVILPHFTALIFSFLLSFIWDHDARLLQMCLMAEKKIKLLMVSLQYPYNLYRWIKKYLKLLYHRLQGHLFLSRIDKRQYFLFIFILKVNQEGCHFRYNKEIFNFHCWHIRIFFQKISCVILSKPLHLIFHFTDHYLPPHNETIYSSDVTFNPSKTCVRLQKYFRAR